MKIRIESSSGNGRNKTGVGYYTRRLTDSLRMVDDVTISESQFDFLGRQLSEGVRGNIERINFPQKVYAKLHYLGLAFPFDLFQKPVDVTIFPNYALWPTVKSKLKVVTVHDLTFIKYPEVVEEKNLHYLKKIVPRAIHGADLVLTVSETVKQEIVDQFEIAPSKVHVTPIPPVESFSTPSNRPIRETYKVPTEKYILFASTIEPRKNLETLLDAYTQLPEKIRGEYSLVIAGGMGWKSEAIKIKLEDLQEKYPNIITTGYYDQRDAAALFQQASVFVMPSLYEGFGMPLLEAMTGETPTIASDIPVLREVGGDASLFFSPLSAGDLSEQLCSVLEDKELAKSLILKGIKNLERYSWNKVSHDLMKKLEELS